MITPQTALPVIHLPLSAVQLMHIDKLTKLEETINRELPPVILTVEHLFAPGMYARKMLIPRGTVATGAIHKTSHLSIISKGRIAFTDENGMTIYEEGAHFISKAGTKRAVYAHEDTILTTIHPTHETNIEQLEKSLVAYSTSEYQAHLLENKE